MKTEATESQNQRIRTYLQSGRHLTARKASYLFDCDRLSARIHDLRAEGMNIETETGHNNKKHFAIYKLEPNRLMPELENISELYNTLIK
jgi:predicted HD phosphohydrolase